MSKADKEYEVRIAGMINAYNIAKTQGIEALEKEIRKRNLLKADIAIKSTKVDEWVEELGANIYNNMLCAVAYTLHRVYGYGKTRLARFVDDYNLIVQDTLDLDYLGEHYVTLEDYAVELNEKFNLGINVERVAACQYAYETKNEKMHDTKAYDGITNLLRIYGFHDAADFLVEHKEKYNGK